MRGFRRRRSAGEDAVFAKVLKEIRPGLRDIDITSIAERETLIQGSEQGIFRGGSSPIGVRSPFVSRFRQGRTLQQGHLSLLIEVNGPGRFYTEIARTVVLGKASQELKDGFAAVHQAQDDSLSQMKPGGNPIVCPRQGYDLVERPLIRHDDGMKLETGMCLAVHPGYETQAIFAAICDNYMIEAKARRMPARNGEENLRAMSERFCGDTSQPKRADHASAWER